MTSASQPANRLARAASPYLLQHAHNPVDWYEWGPEALERARREDRPIFLSIGYAACHWCHVMAHESFENPAIAAEMNRCFVNIKVDREERPDLDDLYMQATQIVNRGQGGWPMSVWLTPELKPFYAGTYFPPESRWGRPGFGDVTRALGEAWRNDRENLLQSAEQLTRLLTSQLTPTASGGPPLTGEVVEQTAKVLDQAFDPLRGGMSGGGTNKFPPSMALEVLLRAAVRRPAGDPHRAARLEHVTRTLDRMAAGGIFDQLAGGIHRYSTDVEWLVPHFEKMLYDQALVSRSYLDAFQLTGRPTYARVARQICDYVLADLTDPGGGFHSSRDADSEGEEGRCYVWTRAEVLECLGPELGPVFCDYYDVSETGNWADPHSPGVAKNILRIRSHQPDEEQHHRFAEARARLLAQRRKRTQPGLDDKVLCEWNGLMIASLARGGMVLDEPRYVAAARRAAEFLFTTQAHEQRLRRASRQGRTLNMAFLTDYAALLEGCLELYEATFERIWFDRAVTLAAAVERQFADEAAGGYYFTAHDHETPLIRTKDLRDSATPSGNSLMLMNLLRLAAMTGQPEYARRAERVLAAFADPVRAAPWAAERFVAGVDFATAAPLEIALIGDPARPEMHALRAVLRETYLPNRVILLADPARPEDAVPSPLLKDRPALGGAPTAYVCRNYACQQPVQTPAELRAQLLSR